MCLAQIAYVGKLDVYDLVYYTVKPRYLDIKGLIFMFKQLY